MSDPKMEYVPCDPITPTGCPALERAVARFEQAIERMEKLVAVSIEASREATAESHRRSEALDDLAKEMRLGNSGWQLKATGEHSAMPDPAEPKL